jgi:hypothetical protein
VSPSFRTRGPSNHGVVGDLAKLIRVAPEKESLDRLISQVWQANLQSLISDTDAEHLVSMAHQRRRDLKTIAAQTAKAPISSHRGRSSAQDPRSPLLQMLRVPRWVGGDRELLDWNEASRAFKARREVWCKQITRDRRLSQLDLRLAWEISFHLNYKPLDTRFGQCFASIKTFAATLICRQQSIVDSSRRLENFGHLRIFHGRGRGNPNRCEPIIQNLPLK